MDFETFFAGNDPARIKTVRLELSSRHILPDPAVAGRMMSLFERMGMPQEQEDDGWREDDPENWPDELADALAEISYMEGIPIPGEEQDGDAPDDEDDVWDDYADDPVVEEMRSRFDQLMAMLQGGDGDEDAIVFETTAEMKRERQPDGSDNLEITYREADAMGDTSTVILLNTGYPELVTIFREGDVFSTLICEKGKRHISAYETPVAPFEMAVFTRSCEGGITFEEGGTLELDYLVELRGMDVQRTKMKITVSVLP